MQFKWLFDNFWKSIRSSILKLDILILETKVYLVIKYEWLRREKKLKNMFFRDMVTEGK